MTVRPSSSAGNEAFFRRLIPPEEDRGALPNPPRWTGSEVDLWSLHNSSRRSARPLARRRARDIDRQLIEPFIDKLVDQVCTGHDVAAVALTPDFTDTGWWHRAARAASWICLKRDRIHFVAPSGDECPLRDGQTSFYFGADAARFRRDLWQARLDREVEMREGEPMIARHSVLGRGDSDAAPIYQPPSSRPICQVASSDLLL
jgi:hypothetical protein